MSKRSYYSSYGRKKRVNWRAILVFVGIPLLIVLIVLGLNFKRIKLLISLITLLCVELLNHPTLGVFDFIAWIFQHKRVMLMNYILYCNVAILIYLIMNRLNWANIIFITLLVIIGICNYYKLLMKGENVVLWDVLNLQAAAGMMTELKIEIGWQVVVSVLVLLIVLYHL